MDESRLSELFREDCEQVELEAKIAQMERDMDAEQT